MRSVKNIFTWNNINLEMGFEHSVDATVEKIASSG